MEVILLERIEKLGQMGDVVHVKPGFARNYLLPKAKALRSNKENMALFEAQKAQLEAANLKRREEAEQIAAKMEGLNLVIIRQAAETGQLYGSVTGRDVRDAVRDAGYNIERRQVVLDQPLKEIGSYGVRIVLHPDVRSTSRSPVPPKKPNVTPKPPPRLPLKPKKPPKSSTLLKAKPPTPERRGEFVKAGDFFKASRFCLSVSKDIRYEQRRNPCSPAAAKH